MDASKMKNMIVIKNLPSNIIDEAFVVLKSNKKMKVLERIEKDKSNKVQENSQNYITKEAEMVLSNYLSNIENNKKIKSQNTKKLEKKYKTSRNLNIILGILLVISVIC